METEAIQQTKQMDAMEQNRRCALSPSPHLWLLLRFWWQPRLLGGFLIATMLLFVVRLACAPFTPLSGEAPFQPLFLLAAAGVLLLGPAGVWAALASSLLADFLIGPWTTTAWFRAAGELAGAMHVFGLWDASFLRRRPALVLSVSWRQVVRFAALGIPAGFVSASWAALGSELHGAHAFGLVASLLGAQVVVFGLLAAPGFQRMVARDIAGPLGDWRLLLNQAGRWAHWRPLGLVAGTAAATALLPLGLLYTVQVTGEWPWDAVRSGASTGGGLPELMAGLLALHAVIVFWPFSGCRQ